MQIFGQLDEFLGDPRNLGLVLDPFSCQGPMRVLVDGKKHGKTGELGQDRLEVRWEAHMFFFNVVNLNVSLIFLLILLNVLSGLFD